MLVLTRLAGESIIIGDNIEVILLGIRGNQARLGINAPTEISVHRNEIYERIQREKDIKLMEVLGEDTKDAL